MNVKIRPGNDSDHNFILSTWLKAYKTHGNEFYKPLGQIFYKEHQLLIKKKLASCSIDIITTDEDETQIIGYMVHDPTCIHFIYVKKLFQGFKLAKELMKRTIATQYSQHTVYSKRVMSGIGYNPYKFYE